MLEPVLDPQQLARIEATHRGFAYQHLYGVACLLSMRAASTNVVIIEHDEDVELIRNEVHIYAQVKTRDRPLRFNDIDTALQRFNLLRDEHAQGRRSGEARFAVVSNVEPGPELSARVAGAEWLADVVLLWPGCTRPEVDDLQLPPAWPDLAAALQVCITQAEHIPFGSLAPETLVLKLAGLVQYIAAGYLGHRVTAAQVIEFFEQLVIQLQELPEAPTNYRPQIEEPDFAAAGRVRLLVGVSGAGKTAWAAYAATQYPGPTAYLDVAELPSSVVASSLARELMARYFNRWAPGAGSALLPSASGLELLAAVATRIRDAGLEVVVVLDNVHRLSVATIRSLVEAASGLRFVMLGQPWSGQVEVEARLGIRTEVLGGWSLDTIAATFAAAGCPINVSTGERIKRVTAGVPLYVGNAAQVAQENYDGDVSRFLDAVEHRLNVAHTVQEAILAETFEHLSPKARTAAVLLDLSDVPIQTDEVQKLVSVTDQVPQSIAAAVRELAQHGVVQLFGGGALKLHDAYRLLARDSQSMLPQATVEAAREALVVMLQQSLPTQWTVARFGLWLRLLPQTGRTDTLIDIATHEEFHQVGNPQELKATLEKAADDPTLRAEERFWALDALVSWEQAKDGSDTRIVELIGRMLLLSESNALDRNARVALSMKQIYSSALSGDRGGVDRAYEAGMQLISSDLSMERFLRYNRAASFFKLNAYEEAASISFNLIMDY